jgi:hypothetical protein
MEQKENIFKVLQLLHRAMLAGMLLFSIIALYITITRQTTHVTISTGKALQIAVIAVAFLSVSGGFFLFNKRMQLTANMPIASERMGVYRMSAIIRWAMIEVPVMFAIISFVLTGNYAFLALALAIMMVFVYTAPSKNKIIQQLQLDDKDVRQLEGQSK